MTILKYCITHLQLDHALGAFGSPGKDIAFILYSSSHISVRSHWIGLIGKYHNELLSCLQLFKYPKAIPTFNEIYDDFMNCGIYIIIEGILCTGLRHEKQTYGDGISGFRSETEAAENYRIQMLSNDGVREELSFLLHYLNANGQLDL